MASAYFAKRHVLQVQASPVVSSCDELLRSAQLELSVDQRASVYLLYHIVFPALVVLMRRRNGVRFI